MEYILDILFPAACLIKGFFFFFLPVNDNQDRNVDEIIEKYPNLRYKERTRALVSTVLNDNFSSRAQEHLKSSWLLQYELSKVKKNFFDIYLDSSESIIEKRDHNYGADIEAEIHNALLRLLRLRMVIDPEVQLSLAVHVQTQVTYISAKSFWMNEDGKKVRKFNKSLGRLDSYEKGKKDPIAIEDGFKKLQNVILEEYQSIYTT